MKHIYTILGLVLLFGVGGVGIYSLISSHDLIARLDAISSNPNPLIRHFAPTWRSIKKSIDLPYIARGALYSSSLPLYEINVSAADEINLILNLPDYPTEYKLLEEFKKSVTAEFQHGSYATADAQVRFRGLSPNHWNAAKKSWQVNLPDDTPLAGRTAYRFFLPSDKGWVWGPLWNRLGNTFNIMTLGVEPVRLHVNGKDYGIYMLIEGWETFMPVFSDKNTDTRNIDLWRSESLDEWYNRENPEAPASSYPELVNFIATVAHTSDTIFPQKIENVLDIGSYLRWTMVEILSGGAFHQGNSENQNFYYNHETKRFEPILFDAALVKLETPIDVSHNRVVNRILQHEPYRKRFEELLRAYVSDETNLARDLAFYDATAAQLLPEIFSDTEKIHTSVEVARSIRSMREVYIYNFHTLQEMLREDSMLDLQFADETYPLE